MFVQTKGKFYRRESTTKKRVQEISPNDFQQIDWSPAAIYMATLADDRIITLRVCVCVCLTVCVCSSVRNQFEVFPDGCI